jgi:uncharacterized protein YjbI with pentapeptide repeats
MSLSHSTQLINKDFRGASLVGKDFSNADIRGANFSGANLSNANFTKAKTGLSPTWQKGLTIFVIFLTFLSGIIGAYGGATVGHLLVTESNALLLMGILALLFLVTFFIVMVIKGLEITIVTLSEVIAACLIGAIAFFPENSTGSNLALGANFTALALIGVMAAVGNVAVAVAISRLIDFPKIKGSIGIIAFFGIVLGSLFGVREEAGFIVSTFVGIASISLGFHIGWQSISRMKKYKIIRSLSIALVTIGGTKFCGANLTNADFSHANLAHADFRNAILTCTNWYQAQGLEKAQLSQTYLENPTVCKLVTSKEAIAKNLNNLDLSGLNLKKGNFQDSSFIGADLSNTTLENANLSGTKLVTAQLYSSNLKQATLTGAYIENWGISTDTQLEEIKCDYIYMHDPTIEDPDPCRKPDNKKEIFSEGDFTNFIAPIIKTLDLYQQQNVDMRQATIQFRTLDLFHNGGLDPQAAAISLTQLQKQHPEAELEVLSLESRGQNNIRVQAKVNEGADRSALSNEYFQIYQELQDAPYSSIQSLLVGLESKQQEINRLENLLANAIQQPRFYIETYTEGDTVNNKQETQISVGGNAGIVGAGDIKDINFQGTMNLGTISGDVTNTIN